jgi:hypothetical protein
MLLGRFQQAWRESDIIDSRRLSDPNRLWDGQTFYGKSVMLRCLHGYGDTIQFIRYAPMLRMHASHLIVEAHPEMATLLRGVSGIDDVITWGAGAPSTQRKWDQQIEIMELPRAFRTTIETIPRDVPYILIDSERLQRSRQHLGQSNTPKIGVIWASSSYNRARSLPFSRLAAILDNPRFIFYSLQRGPERDQVASFRTMYHICDLAEESRDIADTGADIVNLDLTISVDTITAHLAGALARPVWLLLPYEADWRWMVNRTDSPWYPTMRIFRQPTRGDWESVMHSVASELERFRIA